MIDSPSKNVAAAAVDSPSKSPASPEKFYPIASANSQPLWSGFGRGLHTELRAQAFERDGKQVIIALQRMSTNDP